MAKGSGKRKLGDNPEFMRVFGSAPWLKVPEKEHFRTKVFQSGNSISFAPDGTTLAGQKSTLFNTLDATSSTAVWQRQILRARWSMSCWWARQPRALKWRPLRPSCMGARW